MHSKKWYQYSIREVLQILLTDEYVGLNQQEAEKRKEQYGLNQLTEGEQISAVHLLLNQFKDFMVLVLLAATLISGLLGEYIDAIAIIAIVVINALLGFFQEYRAERSLQALKQLSAPTANVIRNGMQMKIAARDLVPGDIVLLESGDRVPADIRLLQSRNLYVEESALTGESVPVLKQDKRIIRDNIALGDQSNLAFMGTSVVRGYAKGVVIATGMNTEMGKIAHLLESTESTQTPLAHRMESLGKVLIVIALILTAVVVVTGILHGHNAYEMLLAGVSLAVAAIPEGLPAIVTISLALGVQRMIKRRAIVRKLAAVETLGCASIICTDKTGTLTQNKMTVTKIYANGEVWDVTGSGYEPHGSIYRNNELLDVHHRMLRRIVEIGLLCNHATLYQNDKGKWEIKGDPTEGSLLVLAAKAGLWKEDLLHSWQFLKENPFDSSRKMMSTLYTNDSGVQLVAVKGAPEVILRKCEYILDHDRVIPLSDEKRNQIETQNNEFAQNALRVIALAYKEVSKDSQVDERNMEENLTFVGLVGMMDPPREEVPEAIATCQSAGVRVVMITGDHKLTATTIAKQIGILPENGLTITGEELDQMSEEEFASIIDRIYVYARVSPENKLKIVQTLQKKGHVVAMTGDGVNDAPAIKASDIGVSMGNTGTDVAKEASAIVLADDNFATIKAAIEEGRSIYDNIRKFVRYLLASNVGEILVMFFAMLLALPLPLLPLQILWVNLVTDGLPALALGLDQPERDTMRQPPRARKESIFARGLGWKIVSRGFLIGFVTLLIFMIVLDSGASVETAQTMAFSTLVVAQLIHVFDCRSEKSIFHRNPFQNVYLLLAVLSSFLLMIAVIYWDPAQVIFKTVDLTFIQWIWVFIFAAIPTFLAGFIGILLGRVKKLFA